MDFPVEVFGFFGTDRSGEEETLNEVASELTQSGQLLSVFHPFGDDFQSQRMRELHDGSYDIDAPIVGIESANEGAIDLQCPQRKLLQITQRRISSSEIVDLEPDTHAPEAMQCGSCLIGIPQNGALRQLQRQALRAQPRFGKSLPDIIGETRVGELP